MSSYSNVKKRRNGRGSSFFNPRLRQNTSQMTTNEKDLAGDTTRVRMGTNMIYGDDRTDRMRQMFPKLSDNAISRAPKRFLLPTRLRTKTGSTISITPSQLEKLDREALEKKREEEGDYFSSSLFRHTHAILATQLHYNPYSITEKMSREANGSFDEIPVMDTYQDEEAAGTEEKPEEMHVHFLEDIYDTLEGPVRRAWR